MGDACKSMSVSWVLGGRIRAAAIGRLHALLQRLELTTECCCRIRRDIAAEGEAAHASAIYAGSNRHFRPLAEGACMAAAGRQKMQRTL